MKLRTTDLLGGLCLFAVGCHANVELGKDRDPNTDGTGGHANTDGGQTERGGAGGVASSTSGGAGNTGASGGSEKCEGACCPSDDNCYSTSAGNGSPGSECLATRDNTLTPNRIQLRQMWLNQTSPVGLTQSVVYQSLNLFTRLDQPICNSNGNSGYVQLMDIDLDRGVARTGFSTFLDGATTPVALQNGLCMAVAPNFTTTATVAGTETDLSIHAADMYVPSAENIGGAYPVGLPNPMPQPWRAAPTVAAKLPKDFNLTAAPDAAFSPSGTDLTKFPTQREQILARFDPVTGDLATDPKQFSGVFFYDLATGTSHAFSPVSWQVLYDTGSPTTYLLIPIRESETTAVFNDPAHPNCVGAYDGSALAPDCTSGSTPTNIPGSPASNAWGPPGSPGDGTAPGQTKGYFLITELEQIYSHVLNQTYCFFYPLGTNSVAAGWGTAASPLCRNSAKWNSLDPVNGIPKGDWCSYDNKPAHDNCHDAYRTVTYQAFAATNIKDGTCDVTSANAQ